MMKIGKKIKIGDYVNLHNHQSIIICSLDNIYDKLKNNIALIFDTEVEFIDNDMIMKYNQCKSLSILREILELDDNFGKKQQQNPYYTYKLDFNDICYTGEISPIYQIVHIFDKNSVLPRYVLRDIYDNIVLVKRVKKQVKYKELYTANEYYYNRLYKRYKSDVTGMFNPFLEKYPSIIRRYKLYFIEYL